MNNKFEKILVVVAHPDDEVLGCGASIAKWTSAGLKVDILIMAEGVTSRDQIRNVESKADELSLLKKSSEKAGDLMGAASVKLLNFPDNRMDSIDILDVIKSIEIEIDLLKPSIVVTHHSGDLNVDHRIVNEAVVTACRPQKGSSVKRILSFEVPSSTEWSTKPDSFFNPNWYEDVSNTLDIKLKAMKIYNSELKKWPHPRSIKGIGFLAKWRGAIIGVDAAESFILIREINS